MIASERNLNPSALPDEQVRMIAAACAVYIRDIFEEKPMTTEETAAFLGICSRQVRKLRNQGSLKARFIPGIKTPRYFKSEINRKFKES